MVDVSEAQTLEPLANFRGATEVAYSPRDGAVDAMRASQRLVNAAQRLGLTLLDNCSVNRVKEGAGGLVVLETDCGEIAVDKYVLATGANQQATLNLAGIDIPQRATPGVVVITKPVPKLLNTIFVAPGVHIHQRRDGRLVLGEQEGAPETEAHVKRLSAHPTRFPSTTLAEQHASRLLETARHFLPSLPKDIALEEVLIGWRPLPLDGHPVLGTSPTQPRSYIAIMHSGVSLAPIVGELVSQELITGVSSSVLEPYRPNRDFQRIQRY
jgi:glycine/D-amino acid oxidase-like deaminating enzyme